MLLFIVERLRAADIRYAIHAFLLPDITLIQH